MKKLEISDDGNGIKVKKKKKKTFLNQYCASVSLKLIEFCLMIGKNSCKKKLLRLFHK
jgi:hypothetical protein